MDSVYKKLEKVRKPRVHISYDLEEGKKSLKKDIPFVVGVMGDYSGHSETSDVPFKDRKFVQIDGDSFNQVMQKVAPKLHLKVTNELGAGGDEMPVDLAFTSMEDFEPDHVAKQIPALKKLLEIRSELSDLMAKADRSDELTGILEQIMQDDGQLKQLANELTQTSENGDNQ